MASNFFSDIARGFAQQAPTLNNQFMQLIQQRKALEEQKRQEELAAKKQAEMADAQMLVADVNDRLNDYNEQYKALVKVDPTTAAAIRAKMQKLSAIKGFAPGNIKLARDTFTQLSVEDFTVGETPDKPNTQQLGPYLPGQEPAPLPEQPPQMLGTPVRSYTAEQIAGMARDATDTEKRTAQTKDFYRGIAANIISNPDKYSQQTISAAQAFVSGQSDSIDWAGQARKSTFTIDDLKTAYANKDWRSAQAAYNALATQGADVGGFSKEAIDGNVARLDKRDKGEDTLLDQAIIKGGLDIDTGQFNLDADKTKLGLVVNQDKQAQQKLFTDWAAVGNVEALEAGKNDIVTLGFNYEALLARAKTNRSALDEERSNTLQGQSLALVGQGLDNTAKAGQIKLANALYLPTVANAELKNDLDRAGLAQMGVNLEQSRENLAFFKDTKNTNVQMLNTQLAAAQQELAENKALSPLRIEQLREAAKAVALDNTLKEKYGGAEYEARIDNILANTGHTKTQTEQAKLELKFGTETYETRKLIVNNQGKMSTIELEASGVNLEQAKAMVAQFKKMAPLQVKQLEATIAQMDLDLEKDKQITPLQVKTLQQQVDALTRDNKIADLYAEPTAKAQLDGLLTSVGLQKTQAEQAKLELKFGTETYETRKLIVNNQGKMSTIELEASGVNLEQAKAMVAQFKKMAPLQVKQLEATIAQMDLDLEKDKQITPLQVKTLQQQVDALTRDNKIADLYAEPTAKAQLDGLLTSVGLQKTQAGVLAATAPGQIAATNVQNQGVVDTTPGQVVATNIKNDAIAATTPGQIAATNAQNQGVVDTVASATAANISQNETLIAQNAAAKQLLPFETENKLDVLALQKQLRPLTAGAQRTEILGNIASQGDVGLAALSELKTKGTITNAEFTSASQAAKDNQLLLNTKTAQADQLLTLLPEQTRTQLSTYARTQSDNDLAVLTNSVATDLLGVKGEVERVGYLADLATTGNLGKPLLKTLLANGKINQEEFDSATVMANGAQALRDNNVLKTKLDATTLKNDIANVPAKEGADFIALADKYANAGTAGLQWLNNPATVKRARELGINLNSFRDDAKDSQVLAEMGQRDGEYKGSQAALAQLMSVDTDPTKNPSALREVAIGLGYPNTVQGIRDARQYVLDQREAQKAAARNAAAMRQLEIDEKTAKINQTNQSTANSVVTTNATVADTNSKIAERANDYIIKRYNSETDRQRANQSYELGVGNLNQRVREAYANNQNKLAQLAINQGELTVKQQNANTAWQTAYNTNSRADRNFAATQMKGAATGLRQSAGDLRRQATSLMKGNSFGEVSDENKAQAAALNAQAAQYEAEAKQYSDALGSMGVSSIPQAPANSTTAIPTSALTTMSNGARVTVSFGLGAKYSPELKKMTGLAYHQGMDFVVGGNGAVHNPFEGATVVRVGNDFAGWGGAEVIQLRLANGNTAMLAHFKKGSIAVKKDDVLGAGTFLATMGATGHAKGAHVHLQIIGADGKTVLNPNEFASNFGGVTAGSGPLPAPPKAGAAPAQPAAPIKNNAPPATNQPKQVTVDPIALARFANAIPKNSNSAGFDAKMKTTVEAFAKAAGISNADAARILETEWIKRGGK